MSIWNEGIGVGEIGISPTVDVLTGDTDLDGDIDIVALNSTGAHQIFVNNGNGQFSLHPEQFASAGPLSIASGKFSVDDRMDVVVTSTTGNGVFLNDGLGNLGLGDTGLPLIQLVGPAEIALAVEEDFVDPGATATDAIDGDLTAEIVVDNPVDTAVVGTYTVTYTVKDSSGNTSTPATRTVAVGVNTPVGGGGGGAIGPWLLGLLIFLAGMVRTRHGSRRPRSRT